MKLKLLASGKNKRHEGKNTTKRQEKEVKTAKITTK